MFAYLLFPPTSTVIEIRNCLYENSCVSIGNQIQRANTLRSPPAQKHTQNKQTYIYIYIGDLLAEFGSCTRLLCLPTVWVSRQVRSDKTEGQRVLANKCEAGIKNDTVGI